MLDNLSFITCSLLSLIEPCIIVFALRVRSQGRFPIKSAFAAHFFLYTLLTTFFSLFICPFRLLQEVLNAHNIST
uniref:Uncharacterized protein n=1 Tax=Solanum lycopersicum TaxID=4081 RepID=A0A3Q7G5Q8_SOLLC